MDTIIEKISEIETVAARILEGASTQKQLLDQEQEKRMKEFDAELEAQTQQEIDALQKQLSGEMEQELDEIRKTSQQQINEKSQWFLENKDRLAEDIYTRIIRK